MNDVPRLAIEMSGGCQCGAIRFHVTELNDTGHICHCRMCQKATGGLFAAAVSVREENLVWTRGTPALFKSSDYVERGFCPHCGTSLFFHYVDAPFRALSIGAFDDPHRIPIRFQIGMEGLHPSLAGLEAIVRSEGTTEASDPAGVARIAACNHQHPDHDTEQWQ